MTQNILFYGLRILPIVQDILLIILAARGFRLHRERAKTNASGLVSLNGMLLWVGCIVGSILSVPITLFTPQDMQNGVWWIFELAVLVCLAMLLAYCNDTIRYNAAGFEASTLFGRKRRYSYGQISAFSRSLGDVILHCEGKRIRLDAMVETRDTFLDYADRAHRRETGKNIPFLKPTHDPMNGNIENPWLHFIIQLCIGLCGVAMAAQGILGMLPPSDKIAENTAEYFTSFSSCEYSKECDGTLILKAPDYEKAFRLEWLDGYEIPHPSPDELTDGTFYRIAARATKQNYSIYAVYRADGTPIIRAFDRNTAYKNTQRGAAFVFLIGGFLGILGSVLGILVGRHPENYPAFVRELFYKDYVWISKNGKQVDSFRKRKRI